jgi:UDP-3-O-acyl-N-acetylglucosamine deacetylase
MLERHQMLDLMGELKLAGTRHAYDEVIADGIKRQHPHQHVVGELLTAEVADKHADQRGPGP